MLADRNGALTLSILICLAAGCSWGQQQVLTIRGKSGQAAVVQLDGRSYVDLEAFVRLIGGSLRFEADRIVFGLPDANTLDSAEASIQSTLSKDFMRAAIEEIALLREWASPLANAIQNGFPVTEHWVTSYREPAVHGLSLASTAASTEADRQAFQLLSNEFEAVRQWSNRLVEARKNVEAAQYSISSSALRDDPQSQKIVSGGHFLVSMLGSGSFQDNSACH